jgi:hypothetical protein
VKFAIKNNTVPTAREFLFNQMRDAAKEGKNSLFDSYLFGWVYLKNMNNKEN